MNLFIEFTIPLLYCVTFAASLSLIMRRSIERMIPVVFFSTVCLIYPFALMGLLEAAYLLLPAIAVVLFTIAIIRYRNRYGDALALLITPGAATFVLLYVGVFIVTLHKGFTAWDEISHWGPMVKETIRTGALYTQSPYVLVHRDYPPAICLLECLWVKLSGGIYAERFLYRALWMMCFSLFLPFIRNVTWERKPSFIIKLVGIVGIIAAANAAIPLAGAGLYNCVYVDCALALLLAYGTLIVLIDDLTEWQTSFSLFTFLMFYSLVKQMAVVFSAFIVVLYCVRLIHERRHTNDNGNGVRRSISLLLPVCVAPLISYFSWKAYCAELGVLGEAQFSLSKIHLGMLLGIYNGTAGEVWQHESMINFLTKLTHGSDLLFGLSYVSAIALALALLAAAGSYALPLIEKKTTATMIQFYVIVSILYAIALCLLYTFCFGSVEGPVLASYSRYMETMVYAILSTAVMVFILRASQHGDKGWLIIFLVCVATFALIPFNMWKTIVKPAFTDVSIVSQYNESAEIIENNTEEGSSIYMVSYGSDGLDDYALCYLTDERLFNGPYRRIDVDEGNSRYLSPASFTEQLRSYDYLYLRKVEDVFWDSYAKEAGLSDSDKGATLYRITVDEDGNMNYARKL